MDDYVKEHGFAGWFETSAKENINIEEAARALVNKVMSIHYVFKQKIGFYSFSFLVQILLNDKIINAGEILDADKFNLDGSSSERSSKKSCSCWRFIYNRVKFHRFFLTVHFNVKENYCSTKKRINWMEDSQESIYYFNNN